MGTKSKLGVDPHLHFQSNRSTAVTGKKTTVAVIVLHFHKVTDYPKVINSIGSAGRLAQ